MIIVAAAVMLAGSDVDLRHTFVACLKNAASEAQRQKIGADGFVAFARTSCAGTEEPFEASLVSANSKHGMSRKDSASDASQQVSDYYKEWNAKYSSSLPPPAKAAPKLPTATPTPIPASEPTEPK